MSQRGCWVTRAGGGGKKLEFWMDVIYSWPLRKNACIEKICPLLIRIKYCCFDSYWCCKISRVCDFWARIQRQVCRSHACNTTDLHQRTQYFQVGLVNQKGYNISLVCSDFKRVWFIWHKITQIYKILICQAWK